MAKKPRSPRVQVTISKVMEYPIGALNPINRNQDAIEKAGNDLAEQIGQAEAIAPLFSFAVTAVGDIKRRATPSREELPGRELPYWALLNALAKREVEKKYGVLDPEQNPDLFVFVEEVRDKFGDLVQEEQTLYREDVENDMQRAEHELASLIRSL